nr:MAG: RNA-dependent RNA polymerase [brine shrimp partitivirus 3]
MPFGNVRNYFTERLIRLRTEQSIYQAHHCDPDETLQATFDTDTKRIYHSVRNKLTESEQTRALEAEYQRIRDTYIERNEKVKEPFEFYNKQRLTDVPINRLPSPGIRLVPHKYHTGQIVSTTENLPETGFPMHPLVKHLLRSKYPEYKVFTEIYCRPLGTTDATFADFNRPQKPCDPTPKDREERILRHVTRFLDAKPYLPIHFVDTQYAKMPLSTGTGYHNRRSFKINAHAKYSHPEEYKHKSTSKGFYINAFLENARTLVHRIKEFGVPFPTDSQAWTRIEQDPDLQEKLNAFFNEYPTMLYTRNHISERYGKLKQRPVYAVDDLFLVIEAMLTFPLLIQARKPSCCIMYGLETIRGSNVYLDKIAQSFRSYFTIDWSSFDQSLPRVITDCYFEQFLPNLIVINDAYQATYEYPTYPDQDEVGMYRKMKNLLNFLHLWYNNMTFVTQDGFAYRRTCAGVPSGQLQTQYIDSFGNLYLIIDGLIEFGCTDNEIEEIRLFIMGDDNSGFTYWSIIRLEQFIEFFERYALERWNMTLSKSKSVITSQRQYIETLSYACNFGWPRKPIGKMVAQLCYPEHGAVDKYMSVRAIGMAYAACGMDETFHRFCRDIFLTFLPYSEVIDEERLEKVLKYLPGQFSALDSFTDIINPNVFPDLWTVRQNLTKWHGPLAFTPRWNDSHFMHNPDELQKEAKTMKMFKHEHSIDNPPPIKLDRQTESHQVARPTCIHTSLE